MSRIILIEGADTITVKHVIDELQSRLEKEGKKVISAMFPMYDNKSSILVNQHIKSFPEPDFDNKLSDIKLDQSIFVRMKDGKVKYGIVKDITQEYTDDFKIKSIQLDNEIIMFDDIESFHSNKNENLFDKKASHITKALTYTMDRIIWLNNNLSDDIDYVLINRSYLSNFLYRTTTMTKSEIKDYVNYIIYCEIKSVGLYRHEVYPIFISAENVDTIYNKIENDSVDNFISKADIMREMQYICTIHSNYNHARELLSSVTINDYKNIYNRLINMIDVNCTDDEYLSTESISNRIYDIIK